MTFKCYTVYSQTYSLLSNDYTNTKLIYWFTLNNLPIPMIIKLKDSTPLKMEWSSSHSYCIFSFCNIYIQRSMQFGAMVLQSKIPSNSLTYFFSNKLGLWLLVPFHYILQVLISIHLRQLMYYFNFKNILFFILALFSVMRIKINTNKEF